MSVWADVFILVRLNFSFFYHSVARTTLYYESYVFRDIFGSQLNFSYPITTSLLVFRKRK